ncbi:MAG TPA: hypothetical protein VE571_01550, partial [Solirubrobacteraceae bacterium]|nr:hypothetical protein [Solirubrobacteraceae bacterium]
RGTIPENAAGLVYGIILVATLLSAESAIRETYVKTVVGVLIALTTYWLALTYAGFTGRRLEEKEGASLLLLGRAAVHELTVLYGALVPLVSLLILWVAGATLDTAVLWSIIVADITMIVAEVFIGVRAELKGLELVGQVVIGAILGALVLGLRLLLH